MGLHSFLIESASDLVKRGPGGYPARTPLHASVSPLPAGFSVHAGTEHGHPYALGCAKALAEAVGGKLFDAQGKLLEDFSRGPRCTWEELIARWEVLDAELQAHKQAKAATANRAWEKETGDDPRTAGENDWEDV